MAGTNYNDERLTDVIADKDKAIGESNAVYDNMITQSDKFYEDQKQLAEDWKNQQTQIQQDNTDFAIEKIEQQREQAQKDYEKEQSGAYVDWRKQSNQYGAQAEEMAAAGLSNTGFSESSQVNMYNTYQNRVSATRAALQLANQNFDNMIKEAQLQNNATLAQLAYDTLQKQYELSLQGFQYKNSLSVDKANRALQLDEIYHGRWNDVLSQINTENALAEEKRQYDLALQNSVAATGDDDNARIEKDDGSGGTLKKVWSTIVDKLAGGTTTKTFTGKTYSDAVKFMKENGVPADRASGIRTVGEWGRLKSDHWEKQAWPTYADYLKGVTALYIKEYSK